MDVPFTAGDIIAGRYVVERTIGSGGMGVVLSAHHELLGERVAVKLLHPQFANDQAVVSRFFREARAAAKIPSEHIARVLDVGLLPDGAPYLVMEYLVGRDLAAELLERGTVPLETAVDYVLQAALGVAEAHSLGIVHRDIKPSNLFLSHLPGGRSCVKVLDFGIAKHTAGTPSVNLTDSFSVLGSAAYMSPEQIRHTKNVDARSDVWSFGVVLYELLTGELPFVGETPTAMVASIVGDPPIPLRQRWPAAPPALEALIAECLEKDRAARIPSLAGLAGRLAVHGGANAGLYARRIYGTLTSPSHAPAVIDEAPAPAAPEGDPVEAAFEDVENDFEEIDDSVEEALEPSDEVDRPTPALPSTRATRNTWSLQSPGAPSSAGRTSLLAALAAVVGGTIAFALLWRPAPNTEQGSPGSPVQQSAVSAAPSLPAAVESAAEPRVERHVVEVSDLPKDPAPPTRRRAAIAEPPPSASADQTRVSDVADSVDLESPYASATARAASKPAPPTNP